MSKVTKMMLGFMLVNAVAAVLFLTGVVDVSQVPGFYVALPLAAIFYGMFVICRVLDKEVAAFNAERGAHPWPVTPEENSKVIHSIRHAHDHHESMAA
jgi:Mg2+/Co2+ transporter CorB